MKKALEREMSVHVRGLRLRSGQSFGFVQEAFDDVAVAVIMIVEMV